MNITLNTDRNTTNYCGAQFLTIEEGKMIFFRGKNKDNAVKIPLNEISKYVDVEISIRSKGSKYWDYEENLKKVSWLERLVIE